MDGQPAVVAVIDKAKLPELVHEVTDPRPGCSNHLCEVMLGDSRKQNFGSALLAEMGKE